MMNIRASKRRFAPNRRAASGDGFTLMELLVVITIIGILIAISLPVLQGMRAKSQQVQCTARMRVLNAAILSYANDNNAALPYIGTSGSDAWWHRRILSYMVPQPSGAQDYLYMPASQFLSYAGNLYRCPSDTAPFAGAISFGMNTNLAGKRTTQISHEVIFLGEARSTDFTTSDFQPNHRGYGQVSLSDGSIRAYQTVPLPSQQFTLWSLSQ